LVHLQAAETTKAAWEALQSAFEDKDVNRRCVLLRKLFGIKLKHHTSMDSYVTQVLSTAQEIAAKGKALYDVLIATLVLQGLTIDYKPMKMAMENSGVELTTDYVKTKLLQEEYNPKNRNSGALGESAFVSQYRSRSEDSAKRYARGNKGRVEGVSGSQLSNSARYLVGSCFICSQRGHKAASSYKNPNKERFRRAEDQQERNQGASLLAAVVVTMKSEKLYLDSGATIHMTNDSECLVNYCKNDEIVNVTCVDNGKLPCEGIGDATVRFVGCVSHVSSLNVWLNTVRSVADRLASCQEECPGRL
jgi:hypothetical protein